MKLDEFNIKNINLDIKSIDFKKLKNLDKCIILDFNNRNFHPENINNIIKLSIDLKINDLQDFIIFNVTPTNKFYEIDEEYQQIIKLPKFMVNNNYSKNKNSYYLRTTNSSPYIYDLCIRSIELNLIKWLKWGIKENKGWFSGNISNHLCNIAAIFNRLDCLKFINEYMLNIKKSSNWDLSTSKYAARYGNYDVLEYLCENNCPYNQTTLKSAIESKSFDCIKYLLSKNIKFDEEVSNSAIKTNDIKILKFFDKLNIPFSHDSAEKIANQGNYTCLKYLLKRNLLSDKDLAAKILYDNSKDDFKNLYFKPKLIEICKIFIKNGNLKCLKEILENYDVKLIFSSDLLKNIRDIEILSYLHKKNLILDNTLTDYLSLLCCNDFKYIIYYVDNKVPGYEKFTNNDFINKINDKLKKNNKNYKIFLCSEYFLKKLKLSD